VLRPWLSKMSSVDPQYGFYLNIFFLRVKGKSGFPFPCVDNPRPHLYPYISPVPLIE
jgi:hypothetical protein